MTPDGVARRRARRDDPLGDAETSLGTMLVAATERASAACRSTRARPELRARFPHAAIEPGGEAMADLLAAQRRRRERAGAAARPAARRARHRVPAGGLARAFPHPAGRVAELRRARRPRPASRRGAGRRHGLRLQPGSPSSSPATAPGRADGSPGGFAYGLERKAALLDREGWSPEQ
jgi:AraC family transcriptional regulator of adaptative response/methylated-DNA-[protein]-cysteine methyltransferase